MKKTTLNIVPINSVVFPFQTIQLHIPSNSVYYKKNLIGSTLGVSFQKNPLNKYSLFSYLTDIGIVIKITDETTETNPVTKKSFKMIRGVGLKRFKVKNYLSKLQGYSADVEYLSDDISLDKEDAIEDSIVSKLKELACRYVEEVSQSDIMAKARFEFIRSESNLIKLHYTVASFLKISDEEKCKLLELNTVKDRFKRLINILEEELYSSVGQPDTEKALLNKNKQQSSLTPFLDKNTSISQSTDDLDIIQNKLQTAGLPPSVYETAIREFNRLKQMSNTNSDYNVQRRYIETLADLPWNESSDETSDINFAEKTLNKDHAGLESVKKRILEFIAVRMLKKNSKGAILCLQGPPGIGKTSLGKSIAEALGKKFIRVALGGVRDEAEIRGHRRTYVGAMPGNFIDAMLKSKTNNPVILLDEIDKVGNDTHRGDPSAALLEVLDPNQNNTFQDHYLGVPFDLSNVLFIATANNLETISGPLLDRMEVISLAGYTQFEKLEIARNYLLPKQVKENGLENPNIEFSDAALHYLIRYYTNEAGVRTLERTIGSICRKVAFKLLKFQQNLDNRRFPTAKITEAFIEEALGPKIYDDDIRQKIDQPGIAIGLAWTQAGGKTLLVEASKSPGKGSVQITGQLGDVMKESVLTAIGWIKTNQELLHLIASKAKNSSIAAQKKIDLSEHDIHIHFPAAAIPKDGPSAGITIVIALISLLTEAKVRDDIAMTGEISLKGSVLPVGGIKEKCLAAYTNGIKTVLLPEQNRRNIEEIPKEIRANMQ